MISTVFNTSTVNGTVLADINGEMSRWVTFHTYDICQTTRNLHVITRHLHVIGTRVPNEYNHSGMWVVPPRPRRDPPALVARAKAKGLLKLYRYHA